MGDSFGKFVVAKKEPTSILLSRVDSDMEYHLAIDLIKASVSDTRDKYYACCGAVVTPKSTYGSLYSTLLVPLQMMCFQVVPLIFVLIFSAFICYSL